MPIYLVKYLSVFQNVAAVEADSQEEAEKTFTDADFFQMHLGEEIVQVSVAEEDYEEKLRAEGYF